MSKSRMSKVCGPAGALFIGAMLLTCCLNSRKLSARKVYGLLTF